MTKTKPVYIEVVAGTRLYLQLVVQGSPPPKFRWFKNGVFLEDQAGQALLLDEVQLSDSGAYTCELENIAGNFVWEEATVSVKII